MKHTAMNVTKKSVLFTLRYALTLCNLWNQFHWK